jgi:FecR-like protein
MKPRNILVAWVVACVMTTATAYAAPVGQVTAIKGRADVMSPGNRAVPLGKGDSVREGDIVRTKSRSRVQITFDDGSIIRLAAGSRIRIDEYAMGKGKDRGILKLFRGKVQSIVKKSRGFFGFGKMNRFEVHTPTAVCGVRGTDYFSSYQAGASHFVFKEGSGYGYNVNRPDQVLLVSAGQAMSLTGADQAPIIRPATDAEMQQHSEDTDAGKPDGDGETGGQAPEGTAPEDEDRGETADEENGETGEGQSSVRATQDDRRDDGDENGGPGRGDPDGPVAAADPRGGEPGDGTGATPEGDAHNGPGDGGHGDAGRAEQGPEVMYVDTGHDDHGPESGTYDEAGPDDYGPKGGTYGDTGPDDYRPDAGIYGEAGPDDYGPKGGTYGDTGPDDYRPDAGIYGEAGPGDYGPDGGIYSGAGPDDFHPDGGIYGDVKPIGYGPGTDGPYLASGYGNDVRMAGDDGTGIYPAGGDTGYIQDPGGYDPGGMPMDGYMPMDMPADYYTMPDPGIYPGDTAIGHDPMDDPAYMGPDDFYYDPPVWEIREEVEELMVNHTISIDADHHLGIRLFGSFSMTAFPPPGMGIDSVEGPLDNDRFFLGTIGSVWYGGAIEGDLVAMYVGTGGKGGIMTADWHGGYAADGTWRAGWTAFTTMEMAASGVPHDPDDPIPNPYPVYIDSIDNRIFPAGAGTIYVENRSDEMVGAYITYADQDWAIWRGGLEGRFTGTPDDDWIVAIEGNTAYGKDMHQWMELIGDQWSGGQIRGKAIGAWVDISEATAGVMGGKIRGIYNPADPSNVWDIAAGGAALEATRFLAMANGAPGEKAILDNLGIPRFEVGQVNLSGSDSQLNVNMKNVTFFAFSTGNAPRLWATDDVSGSYTAAPAPAHTVTLSGGGMSADFKVHHWAGGTWAGGITSNGTQTLTRTDTAGSVDLSFDGGAAGNYTGGTFSGTAAGVVKPMGTDTR